MTANEFCSLQHCRNYGCSKLNRDKDLCQNVTPPRKPSEVRRGTECTMQTPRWSIKDCREKKCDFLGTEELINGGRCCLFGKNSIMPGTLTRCLQDPEMPPEELLDKIPLPPIPGEKEEDSRWQPRKSPGIKNCPELCPYKLIEEVDGSGKRKIRKGTCAFCGETLGGGCGVCHTTILDGGDLMKAQIGLIGAAFERREHPPSSETCGGYCCPDGVYRCEKGETSCPLIKVPFADLPDCPLWRIPAKLLPAPADTSAAARVQETAENVEKSETPEERLARGKAIREEVLQVREETKRMSEGKSRVKSQRKTKPAEPEKAPAPEKKRAKKEKTDPICDHCRERMKGNVPEHACEWCREEQEKKGRRAWVTDIKLGSVLLGDTNDIGQRVPDESVDVICTDPPYIQELYEKAYANLAELAYRVLKPYGFLFTYVPNEHLDEIMDLMRFSTGGAGAVRLKYFWTIQSINGGQVAKNHHHNALCMHKQILVFQKVQEDGKIRGARRCFADVVRGFRQKRDHPWQQSVHDLISFLDRFMQPGEILLDPFAGTGTSLIAGQLLGMDVIGFEIDEKTHAIAVREMQQRPMDLEVFGIEAEAAECAREPVPEQKDTTKQVEIEDPAKGARPVETTIDKLTETCFSDGKNEVVCEDCAAKPSCPKRKSVYFEPFNVWQMRNCAGCLFPDPCGWREQYLTNFTNHGPAADLPQTCPYKIVEKTEENQQQPTTEGHHCGNCGHHKGKKTFAESCVRVNDLLFKGGTYSAAKLMAETADAGFCDGWVPKPEKPKKKPAEKTKPRKVPETANPLYRFLNEHHDKIVEGKDVPIVPPRLVEEEYGKEEKVARRPLKLFLTVTYNHGGKFWSLSQSGKLKPIKKTEGGLHCGRSTPECLFSFQWRYASKLKGDDY